MGWVATIRDAVTGVAIFLFLAMVTGLISANVRQLASVRGWDTILLRLWEFIPQRITSMLAGWGPLEKRWGLWLALGLSAGFACALWIVPERSPPSGSPNHAVGPTFSIEAAQLFHGLPQPCLIKLTDPSTTDIGQTIAWVLRYGNIPSGPICDVQPNELESADDSAVRPATEPGIVIHWNPDFVPAEKVVAYFSSMGLKMRVSHRLDQGAPRNLIWIDIGPGSPWK